MRNSSFCGACCAGGVNAKVVSFKDGKHANLFKFLVTGSGYMRVVITQAACLPPANLLRLTSEQVYGTKQHSNL